ncbi:MAG: NnrU family protein [Chromatiaceae bacterium]|nr:MAG: NnrU family protein [Chromatiaceae bacterium]
MLLLLAGLLLFLGLHSLSIINSRWREVAIARVGETPYQAGFGLLALAGLVMIIYGYGAARGSATPLMLYDPPTWLRHLSLLLMLPVFPLLFAAYMPGRIQAVTRHPMLLAVKLWAVAHLLANGMLWDLLLFGGFLAWAVADRISLKYRTPLPVSGAPPGRYNDLIAVALGLGLYVAFLLVLHRWLMGVAPIG